MIVYHLSPNKHDESILKEGLRPSTHGIDGPGLYAYREPLINALREGSFSILDSNYELPWDVCLKDISVWEVKLPDGTKDIAGWPEYGAFQVDIVPPENLRKLGELIPMMNNLDY